MEPGNFSQATWHIFSAAGVGAESLAPGTGLVNGEASQIDQLGGILGLGLGVSS